MNKVVREFFANQERASNLVIWGGAAVIALAFVGALLAMAFVK